MQLNIDGLHGWASPAKLQERIMTQPLTPLHPVEAADLLRQGRAVLVDIREPHEFAQQRAQGAVSRPLSTLGRTPVNPEPDKAVIFTCLSGMRTSMNAARLAAAVEGAGHVLSGGLNAWTKSGLPVEHDAGRPGLGDLLLGRARKG
jgi:rhodanese-related sulfurtransferase